MSSSEVALALALMGNFGGLVWGAATISSSVKALAAAVVKLEKVVDHLDNKLDDHDTRLAVLESKGRS